MLPYTRVDDDFATTFWDKDLVFYAQVLGSNGLERRVVVLCVNQARVGEHARERLDVGISRATELLIVVGDPEIIAEMSGDDVATRLGLPLATLTTH